MIEQAFFARLAGFAGLAALVGARIYPVLAPEAAAAPFVVYQRITGERIDSLSGPSGMATPRFQVDVYATSYAASRAIAEQVRLALDNFRGTQSYPGGSTHIRFIALADERDLIEQDVKPAPLYRASMDFTIFHDE
jgi:hypothetical protein